MNGTALVFTRKRVEAHGDEEALGGLILGLRLERSDQHAEDVRIGTASDESGEADLARTMHHEDREAAFDRAELEIEMVFFGYAEEGRFG
jgi:hypothetical protein